MPLKLEFTQTLDVSLPMSTRSHISPPSFSNVSLLTANAEVTLFVPA